MIMGSDIRELNDDELDGVSGGSIVAWAQSVVDQSVQQAKMTAEGNAFMEQQYVNHCKSLEAGGWPH
jgi:hypothetical protein